MRGLILALTAVLALTGCRPVLTSRVPVLPTGVELPHGVMPRDLPTGTGDTLTVTAEAMRVGTRYVISAPAGRVGSVAFVALPDIDPSRLQVPGGEARTLYLAQGRVTAEGLERLLRGTRRANQLAASLMEGGVAGEERYLFGFFALMRQGTDAPRMALVQCGPTHDGQGPLADAIVATAARQGLKLDGVSGLSRLPNRDLALSVLTEALRQVVAGGTCRADLPLSLPDL